MFQRGSTSRGMVSHLKNRLMKRSVTTDRTTLSPRARLTQVLTLITVQFILGVLIIIAFVAAAPAFVDTFIPGGVDVGESVRYVRLSSASLGVGLVDVAVSLGTRALDHPE